jgi:hypothetical protein
MTKYILGGVIAAALTFFYAAGSTTLLSMDTSRFLARHLIGAHLLVFFRPLVVGVEVFFAGSLVLVKRYEIPKPKAT